MRVHTLFYINQWVAVAIYYCTAPSLWWFHMSIVVSQILAAQLFVQKLFGLARKKLLKAPHSFVMRMYRWHHQCQNHSENNKLSCHCFFVNEIHWWLLDFLQKQIVSWTMFQCNDVNMYCLQKWVVVLFDGYHQFPTTQMYGGVLIASLFIGLLHQLQKANILV